MDQVIGGPTSVYPTKEPRLVLASDLTVVDVTEAFLAAWSLTRDEVIGRPVFEVFPDKSAGATGSAQAHELAGQSQADKTLPFSESCFHLALEAAGDGVWDWYIPENRFLFSARVRAMVGYV